MSQLSFKPSQHRRGWLIGGCILAIAASAVPIYRSIHQSRPQPAPPAVAQAPVTMAAVTALGRLEPQGEVLQLSMSASTEGGRIAQLLVKPRDRVQKGQVIAIMDHQATRQAALVEAQKEVAIAQAKLAQVQAGAKKGQLDSKAETVSRVQVQLQQEAISRQASIDRMQAQVNNARAEFERRASLFQEGALSASERDRYLLALQTAETQLKEAIAQRDQSLETLQKQVAVDRANLAEVAEVRPVDVLTAQRELEGMQAKVQRAQAELEMTYLRSPIDGEILKVHTREGETISSSGIVEIGQTQQMYAVAEVYETDVPQVKVGQSAEITLLNSAGQLKGVVSEIGAIVGKKDVLDTDPATDIDARVVEVKIRLDPESSDRVTALSNAKIKARILL